MKKVFILFFAFFMGVRSFADTPPNIDERFVRSFQLAFPNAKQVSWYEAAETYQVYFEEDEIKTRISYWKDGLYVQFLRYYRERNLPSYIQYRVKKEYPGKTISSITELSTISGRDNEIKVEYNIKLEDAKTWITLRLDTDGHLKMVEKFRKA